MEKHLSKRTNSLFDLEDKIVLYDLTNTYFEGRKQNSSLAQFGRSKEKRNDCKLEVLALVVNVEGFVKYSAILEGNIADNKTLLVMIDKLCIHTITGKPVVVIDADIATEENMLCDSPPEYMRETESLEFITSISTVWNETVPLSGRVGEYVALARRNGSDCDTLAASPDGKDVI